MASSIRLRLAPPPHVRDVDDPRGRRYGQVGEDAEQLGLCQYLQIGVGHGDSKHPVRVVSSGVSSGAEPLVDRPCQRRRLPATGWPIASKLPSLSLNHAAHSPTLPLLG